MVCLVWLAVYTAELRNATRPRKFLTLFALVCTLLFICHAWFFLGDEQEFSVPDALYLFCNLSVYPLFYTYVKILTQDEPFRGRVFLMLLPGLVIAVAAYFTGGNRIVLGIGRVVFAIEVVLLAFFGLRDLARFDREVQNYYSDVEGKTLQSTRELLITFVLISLFSLTANVIGREYFLHSLLLGVPSVIFSWMLFCIFHMSMKIGFYARDFKAEKQKDDADEGEYPEFGDTVLESKIAALMDEQKLYLRPGLKITDVAVAVGSNRTYVSNAINNVAGVSFAEYVNERRIEYAKARLSEGVHGDEKSISAVASESGFASLPSFYRAFMKYVGESPSSWLKGLKG